MIATDEVRTFDLSTGRLEIFINRQWGTVCSDGFDIADADVACRQLGFHDGAVSYNSASNLGYVLHRLVDTLNRTTLAGSK